MIMKGGGDQYEGKKLRDRENEIFLKWLKHKNIAEEGVDQLLNDCQEKYKQLNKMKENKGTEEYKNKSEENKKKFNEEMNKLKLETINLVKTLLNNENLMKTIKEKVKELLIDWYGISLTETTTKNDDDNKLAESSSTSSSQSGGENSGIDEITKLADIKLEDTDQSS
jgi:hypothetical protein